MKPSRKRMQIETNHHTQKTLEHLKASTGIQSEAQIIRIAIQLFDEIVQAQARGETVALQKGDQSIEKLKLIY